MDFCVRLLYIVLCYISGYCGDIEIVSRAEWGARPPKSFTEMDLPIQYLFIHHTAGSPCTDQKNCSATMRKIQNFHMDDRGWDDIGYNYLIGGDGRAYEARGWSRVGAHTYGYNNVGVAISLMGNYAQEAPSDVMLKATRKLIQRAINEGVLKEGYQLFGHRDGGACTECPGDRLYKIIRNWTDYSFQEIPKYCPSIRG